MGTSMASDQDFVGVINDKERGGGTGNHKAPVTTKGKRSSASVNGKAGNRPKKRAKKPTEMSDAADCLQLLSNGFK